MNTIKELYSSPTTKILEVKFEGAILQASGFSSKGTEFMTVDSEEDF